MTLKPFEQITSVISNLCLFSQPCAAADLISETAASVFKVMYFRSMLMISFEVWLSQQNNCGDDCVGS